MVFNHLEKYHLEKKSAITSLLYPLKNRDISRKNPSNRRSQRLRCRSCGEANCQLAARWWARLYHTCHPMFVGNFPWNYGFNHLYDIMIYMIYIYMIYIWYIYDIYIYDVYIYDIYMIYIYDIYIYDIYISYISYISYIYDIYMIYIYIYIYMIYIYK